MKTVLHVGYHKTATTAIQTYLRDNRGALRAKGFAYPDFAPAGDSPRAAGHFHFAARMAEGEGAVEAFRPLLAEQGSGADVLFLSAESMIRHMLPPAEGQDATSTWAPKLGYIERLRRLFPGPDVEILFTLREPFALAESFHQEFVRKTRYSHPFLTYLQNSFARFDVPLTLSLWQKVFPSVAVRSYDADLRHPGGVVGALLADYCPGFEVAEPALRRNVSLHVALVDFLRLANPVLADEEKRDLLKVLFELSGTGPFAERRSFWSAATHGWHGVMLANYADYVSLVHGVDLGQPWLAERSFGGISGGEVATVLEAVARASADLALKLERHMEAATAGGRASGGPQSHPSATDGGSSKVA